MNTISSLQIFDDKIDLTTKAKKKLETKPTDIYIKISINSKNNFAAYCWDQGLIFEKVCEVLELPNTQVSELTTQQEKLIIELDKHKNL